MNLLSRFFRPQGKSLGQKILIPFFLILSILGAGATVVSVVLIREALLHTADQRLQAFQEVTFREIKNQENLLESFGHVIRQTFRQGKAASGPGPFPTFEATLHRALREARIEVLTLPADLHEFPFPPVRRLLEGTPEGSGAMFHFLADDPAGPVLAVAAPFAALDREPRLLLLRTPLDAGFLQRLAGPFGAHAYLLSREGMLLAADPGSARPPELDERQLRQVLTGGKLYLTRMDPRPSRYLFYAVPLGTEEILVLALELPMADLAELIDFLATGSVLAITLALGLGGYVYYRLIRQIVAPTEELLGAIHAIGQGRLDHRVGYRGPDELGRLGAAFNRMAEQLQSLSESRLEKERQLALAQESLRYKEMVEEKNREIERANRDLKVHLKEISALFQLNRAMISSLDTDVLFDRMMEVLREVLQCDMLALLLCRPGTLELESCKAHGIEPERLEEFRFRLDEGITGRAAREQKLYYLPDLADDPSSLPGQDKAGLRGSMVSVPLVVKKRLKGVLNIHKTRIDSFSENEISLIQAVANQAAIALENTELYEKSRNLSNTDELTGLANRRYFQEILQRELAQARRYGSSFAVIMADIDHFKRYNDLHGHLQGDLVLRKVASILLQNTRGIDLVARFGGEEFVILLPRSDRAGAEAAAEKLRRCVAAEDLPGGRVTLSLGVAEFPADSREAYELLDLADRALYRAKQQGRDRTAVWTEVDPPQPGAQPSA